MASAAMHVASTFPQVLAERHPNVAAMRLRDMALAHGGLYGEVVGITVQGLQGAVSGYN